MRIDPLQLEQEARWASQARQGDEQAFAQLVEALQVPVYNLCYRMLGDPAEAEDAAQEAFLKAVNHLGRFRSESRFSTWLYRIAVNHSKLQ